MTNSISALMRTTDRQPEQTTPLRGEDGVVHPGTGGSALRPGFSLPELAVVLTVVGLLSYLVVPSIDVLRFRMDGASRGAVAALVSAQRQAVKRQHDVVVVLDTAGQRLVIHQDRNGDGDRDAGEPIRSVTFDDGVVFGLGDAPPPGANASIVTFTDSEGDLPAVRFHRDGSASEEGEFFLTSERSLGAADHAEDARRLRVDRATGRVTWYQYRSQRWAEAF